MDRGGEAMTPLWRIGHWLWYGGWPKSYGIYGDTYISRDGKILSAAIYRYKKTWRYRLGMWLCNRVVGDIKK